jgi:acyl-CoA synthetase (AMP-forming)/AMP-acid ligase II
VGSDATLSWAAYPNDSDGAPDVGMVGGADGPIALGVPNSGSELPTEDLIVLCRTHLELHEIPVSVTRVDRLPRNSVGKLDSGAAASARTSRLR